jgi:uncharacterized protein YjiS (DUF1127 family)
MGDIMKTLALTIAPGIAERMPARSPSRPSLLKRIAAWHRVSRERRRLLELDSRLLADMGLTQEEAAWEASRPFWDVDPSAYR